MQKAHHEESTGAAMLYTDRQNMGLCKFSGMPSCSSSAAQSNVTQPKEERGPTRRAPTKQGETQGSVVSDYTMETSSMCSRCR